MTENRKTFCVKNLILVKKIFQPNIVTAGEARAATRSRLNNISKEVLFELIRAICSERGKGVFGFFIFLLYFMELKRFS